jgi:hypothetical protein
MSRTTAYSSSATPRMISPSTKASAGACLQLDLDAAVLLQHLDVEVGIAQLRRARVVGIAADGEHRQRALAQQVMQAAAGGIAQARDLRRAKARRGRRAARCAR